MVCAGQTVNCWVLSGLWFHRLNLLAQCDGSELTFRGAIFTWVNVLNYSV